MSIDQDSHPAAPRQESNPRTHRVPDLAPTQAFDGAWIDFLSTDDGQKTPTWLLDYLLSVEWPADHRPTAETFQILARGCVDTLKPTKDVSA